MKVALEQEQREQLAKCQALLDQQAYAAAATLLSALVPDLFHQGLTQTFLELFKRLPRTEQDADPELICAAGDAWRLHND